MCSAVTAFPLEDLLLALGLPVLDSPIGGAPHMLYGEHSFLTLNVFCRVTFVLDRSSTYNSSLRSAVLFCHIGQMAL